MKKNNYLNIILTFIVIGVIIFDGYINKTSFQELNKSFNKTYSDIIKSNLQNENNILKKMLNLKNDQKVKVVRGRFINLYDEFIIDKGNNDNIKEGHIILNEKRLIGIVRNVEKNYSNVELLENLKSNISVRINDNYGILKNENDQLIVTGLSTKNMNIGSKVYTSGLTDIPENIYIGKVTEIINKDDTFETVAIISIEKDYNSYRFLMVMAK